MDPANGREALREALLDVEEGADMVMVKPALAYRDVIARASSARRGLPVAAYNVSGEYAMVKAAAAAGLPRRARRRCWRSSPRCAARAPTSIITYHAKDAARWLAEQTDSDDADDGARQAATQDPQPQGRRGGPARRPRPAPAEPDAGQLPDRSRAPTRAWPSSAEIAEEEVMARVQRLLDERIIRQVTPIFDTRALGYSSMLVAAKVDPEHPHRAAQVINAHPGVSHNYLRNHEFNLWFTIATEPDSQLGLEGTLEVLAREAGAESVRQLPTLKLFKIRMDLEMEGDTEALASAGRGAASRSSSSRSPTTSSTSP